MDSYSGSWPVPFVHRFEFIYISSDLSSLQSSCSQFCRPIALSSSFPFQSDDTAVGLIVCGFAPTNSMQIMLPTGRKINILNVLVTAFSVEYGKEREIWFWKAVHPDCLLNVELATAGDFRL